MYALLLKQTDSGCYIWSRTFLSKTLTNSCTLMFYSTILFDHYCDYTHLFFIFKNQTHTANNVSDHRWHAHLYICMRWSERNLMWMYRRLYNEKEALHNALKWKIWTLFNNWFSVINNLKIFYKESQTQYFTKFSLVVFLLSVQKKMKQHEAFDRGHRHTNSHHDNRVLSAVLCDSLFFNTCLNLTRV